MTVDGGEGAGVDRPVEVGKVSVLTLVRASHLFVTTATAAGFALIWFAFVGDAVAGVLIALLAGVVTAASIRWWGPPSWRLPVSQRAVVGEAIRTGGCVDDVALARAVVRDAEWLLPHLQRSRDQRWFTIALVPLTLVYGLTWAWSVPAMGVIIVLVAGAMVVGIVQTPRRIADCERARVAAQTRLDAFEASQSNPPGP